MPYRVRLREVEPRHVLCVRATVRTTELVAFFEETAEELRAHATASGIPVTGPAMSLWHSAPGEIEDGFDVECCLPVERPASTSGRIVSKRLEPGVEAFTVHAGAYDDMVLAFDAVWGWIGQNGYEPAGPPRDVVLVGPRDTDDVSAYRTEVVYPVSRP